MRSLPDDQCYSGRAPHMAILNVSIPRDARDIVRQYAPSPKNHGLFINRLLYEYAAKMEERARVRQLLQETDE
jgi:hypothetical protein